MMNTSLMTMAAINQMMAPNPSIMNVNPQVQGVPSSMTSSSHATIINYTPNPIQPLHPITTIPSVDGPKNYNIQYIAPNIHGQQSAFSPIHTQLNHINIPSTTTTINAPIFTPQPQIQQQQITFSPVKLNPVMFTINHGTTNLNYCHQIPSYPQNIKMSHHVHNVQHMSNPMLIKTNSVHSNGSDMNYTSGSDTISIGSPSVSTNNARNIQPMPSQKCCIPSPVAMSSSALSTKSVISTACTRSPGVTHSKSGKRKINKCDKSDKPRKVYQCSECGKGFRQNSNLINHLRVHTGEKPFKCHLCDKAFKQKNNLTRHIRVHTGEKPYKCKYCEAAFKQSCSLKMHQRIHTGEKPFQCNICLKKFRHSNSLRYHINSQHRK